MTQEERDRFVCMQSIKIVNECGYVIPEDVALNYLYDLDDDKNYRLDVLESVFHCVAYAVANDVDEKVREAFVAVIEDCYGVVNAGEMAEMAMEIGNKKGPGEGLLN